MLVLGAANDDVLDVLRAVRGEYLTSDQIACRLCGINDIRSLTVGRVSYHVGHTLTRLLRSGHVVRSDEPMALGATGFAINDECDEDCILE